MERKKREKRLEWKGGEKGSESESEREREREAMRCGSAKVK